MPFSRIVGHRRIVELLSRSIARGTLPPSLVFSGPEGVGKRLVATAVAQAYNCTLAGRPDSGTPAGAACGQCAACSRIARGIYPDVVLVSPGDTGSIKIEQVRDVLDQSMYRPFEGRKRVTIFDNVDATLPAAQNALLKTLEEPASSSVFILVTARPDALLPTVRSRCSQIRFARLSASDVAAVLERDHGYSKRDALAVAAASSGSIGAALNARAEMFSEARSDAEMLLRAARQRTEPRSRVARAKDLVKAGGGSPASEREHLGLRLQALSSLTRDLGLLASGGARTLVANADLTEELDTLSRSFGGERALDVFAAIDRAREALERNVSPKVVADWLALQI